MAPADTLVVSLCNRLRSKAAAAPLQIVSIYARWTQQNSVGGWHHVHIPEASLYPADLRCQAQPMQGGTQRIDLADFDRDGPSQCDQPGRRLPFALPMESSKLLPIIAAGEDVNQCVQDIKPPCFHMFSSFNHHVQCLNHPFQWDFPFKPSFTIYFAVPPMTLKTPNSAPLKKYHKKRR